MSSAPLFEAVQRLTAGGSLTATECQEAVATILDNQAPEDLTRAFLTALHQKGESADELLGAVWAIRERMIAFDCDPGDGVLVDTCGTGGDGAETVNVSTGAAIVLAACGVRVVKHGNRAATGRSGSSDVLNLLGVDVEVGIPVLRRCLDELGIAFLFAPRFHPGLRGVAAVRRQLPFRTLFNLVGPLCNPASPSHQLVGVPGDSQARLMAAVLARTESIRRAVVVTGGDGLDEVTLDGPTRVRVVEPGTIRELVWSPDDFGLPRVHASELRISSPEASAGCLRAMFAGEPGPVRSIVLANAAAALWTVSPGPLPALVARGPGHRLPGRGPAGRALVRADPGGSLKTEASQIGPAVEPEPILDPQPAQDGPVLAIPGSTIGRQVLWLAGPVFIEQSLLYLIGLSDTILAGRHLAADHLAGVTVASYLLWFLGTLFTIASIGGTALVARSMGAGRADEAARFCGQAFAIGLSLGFVAALLVQLLAPWIVAAMNLTGLAALSATRFLRIVGAVTPLLASTAVGNAALRGAGGHQDRNEGDGADECGQYQHDLAPGTGLGADSRTGTDRDRDRHGVRRSGGGQRDPDTPDPGPLRAALDGRKPVARMGKDQTIAADQPAGSRR